MVSRFLETIAGDIESIIADDLPWERLAGCKVVVTGASGFIGSYLTRTLLNLYPAGKVDRPVQVVGIVRSIERARARYSDLSAGSRLTLIECDLSHPHNLNVNADWFIHAASQASPKYYGIDPVGTSAPNVIGTYHLLSLAQASRAQSFLFVSSSEVYGANGARTRLAEEDYGIVDPTSVRSSYAESKRMGENLCISWMHQYGLPVHIVRPFHTYGPGLDLGDGRVFADFAGDVVAGRDIRMTSDGTARRAFCYISDAITGFIHVILKGSPGQPYNVANASGDLSILELAELMTSLFPEKRLKVHRKAVAEGPYLQSQFSLLLPDVSKLEQLGWSPKVSPADGFKRMIESYQ